MFNFNKIFIGKWNGRWTSFLLTKLGVVCLFFCFCFCLLVFFWGGFFLSFFSFNSCYFNLVYAFSWIKCSDDLREPLMYPFTLVSPNRLRTLSSGLYVFRWWFSFNPVVDIVFSDYYPVYVHCELCKNDSIFDFANNGLRSFGHWHSSLNWNGIYSSIFFSVWFGLIFFV